jgi:thioredoxin 1
MGSASIVTLTGANFELEALQSPTPVLVDFWAEWCGPCKMLAPVLDQLAGEYLGRVKIAKVNIDDCQELAAAYQVNAVPNLLLFKQGQVVDQIIGMRSARELKTKLDQALTGT